MSRSALNLEATIMDCLSVTIECLKKRTDKSFIAANFIEMQTAMQSLKYLNSTPH